MNPSKRIELLKKIHSRAPFDCWEAYDELVDLIESRERELAEEITERIERVHLGKGFDGQDRWEHCAAEIIANIKTIITNRWKTDQPNTAK